ncbi:MAG: S8 family serine peptidase [Steroidobacteraceae bacterium]
MRRRLLSLLGPLALLAAGCADLAAGRGTAPGSATPGDTRPFVVVAVPSTAPRSRIAPPGKGSYLPTTGYGIDPGARRRLAALARDYHLRRIDAWPIRSLGVECAVFGIESGESRDGLLALLTQDPRVRLAQPLQEFTTRSAGGGSAGGGSAGAGGTDPYAAVQANLRDLGVGAAHRWSQGRGVRIAVVDTGLDTAHPDLAGRIDTVRNFVDRDARQFNRDRHGTAVAGIIAADAGNDVGIGGIAPQARLLALKACWQLDGTHDAARCNSFTLAQALSAAIDLRARIINLSLVGPPDPLLAALARRAIASGITVVGAEAGDAAGGFPGNVPGVLAVASDAAKVRAAHVLYAPGREVLTLAPGGRYDFFSGDSIATAEISGIAALLLARDASLDAEGMRALLAGSGNGERNANACEALRLLLKEGECAPAEVEQRAAGAPRGR